MKLTDRPCKFNLNKICKLLKENGEASTLIATIVWVRQQYGIGLKEAVGIVRSIDSGTNDTLLYANGCLNKQKRNYETVR
jgi:hypothetical protein